MDKNQGVLAIPLQKLFVITIVVKVTLSFLAWLLSSPWFLGFWAPLAMMAIYIVIGFARRGEDVGDEKFGDSCYYLGFIFTISSIAFSLFDVPQLDQAGKLKDIAVRFGAAMVSTFFGIIVRIYLVGFKRDADQAFDRLEERLITAADELRGRIELSIESFRHFEAAVHEATRDVAARANMAFETLGRSFSTEFTTSLSQVTSEAREVFVLAASEIQSSAKSVTEDLRRSVGTLEADLTASLSRVTIQAREGFVLAATELQAAARGMSEGLRQCVRALDADVRTRETESHRIIADLQTRFDAISLPEDFFSKKLEVPVSNLVATIGVVQDGLRSSATALQEGIRQTGGALEELRAGMKESNAQLAATREQKEVLSSFAADMTTAAQALLASAQAIKEQRDLVAQLVGATVSKRQNDDETSQGLRLASEQITVAASTLQRGAESLQATLRAAAPVVRPAPTPAQPAVPGRATAVRPTAAPIGSEVKIRPKGEERWSIFGWRPWR